LKKILIVVVLGLVLSCIGCTQSEDLYGSDNNTEYILDIPFKTLRSAELWRPDSIYITSDNEWHYDNIHITGDNMTIYITGDNNTIVRNPDN